MIKAHRTTRGTVFIALLIAAPPSKNVQTLRKSFESILRFQRNHLLGESPKRTSLPASEAVSWIWADLYAKRDSGR
jgi:hypothetical protein